jgi:hypothetical protein
MEIKDLMKKEFTSFVPTHVLNTDNITPLGEWYKVNRNRDNWLDGTWSDSVKCISRISDDFIVVMWKDTFTDSHDMLRHSCSVYKGKLS